MRLLLRLRFKIAQVKHVDCQLSTLFVPRCKVGGGVEGRGGQGQIANFGEKTLEFIFIRE